MGLKTDIGTILLTNEHLAFRPSQTYLIATGLYSLFTITGGAIEILTLGGRVTSATVGGASTVRLTANGINTDAAAVAVATVGTVVYSCVNVGGTLVNAAAVPKTVATLTTMIVGTQPTTPGLIACTFAGGTSITMEFFVVYRKLSADVVVNMA